jgi:hypothetical protein
MDTKFYWREGEADMGQLLAQCGHQVAAFYRDHSSGISR